MIKHRDAGEAGFVQRDRTLNVDLDGLTILLELLGKQRAVRQPDAQARMAQQVGGYARLAVGFEIFGRRDHGKTAGRTDRNCNHVARHQVRPPQAKIEPFGNDVHDPAFGDKIDVNLWIAPQEFQQKGSKYFPRTCRECIDSNSTRRVFLLRADGPHRIAQGLYGRPDMIDEGSSGVRQGNTSGSAIEQPDPELALELSDEVAQCGGRQTEIRRRCPERAAPRDSEDSIKLD